MILHEIHYEQLRNVHKSVADTRRRLIEKQSELDVEISRLYHELEKADIAAINQAQFLSDLQTALKKRRVVKEELRGVQVIYNSTRESVEKLNESLQRARNKSQRMKESLNINLSIYEVF